MTHEIKTFEAITRLKVHLDYLGSNKVAIIGFDADTNDFVNVQFPMPKRLKLSTEYLLKQVNKQKYNGCDYKNLSEIFAKIIPNGYAFYPTTYGIGVERLFVVDANKDIERLQLFLQASRIEFRTEYSDARWVYRFVISKSKENIEKIKSLKYE